MTRSTKTRLIGVAAIASLVAGTLLMIAPLKAQGYIGDIRSVSVDPGSDPRDWPAGSEEREQTRRRGRGHIDRRSDRVYLVTPSMPTETITSYGVAGRAPAELEDRIGRDAVSDRQHAYALAIAKRRWRERVAEVYGPNFAQWERANDKRIQCTSIDGELECEVSAIPNR